MEMSDAGRSLLAGNHPDGATTETGIMLRVRQSIPSRWNSGIRSMATRLRRWRWRHHWSTRLPRLLLGPPGNPSQP